MTKIKCTIWGRKFNLPVDYDCYPGESILEEQKKALTIFDDDKATALSDISAVKKYCKKINPEAFKGDVDNVFRYVMPTSVYVKRSIKKHIIAILCNYRYDEENGIAIVIENGKIKEIGPQDIIL